MYVFRRVASAFRSFSPKRHEKWIQKMEKELAQYELPEFTLPEGFVFHQDKQFLEKLTDQFIEFVRVIDEVDYFFMVRDVEYSKPWLQIGLLDSDSIVLNIGSGSDYELDALPWLENLSDLEFTRTYEIPREFFNDPLRVSYLLSVIFRTYSDVVIELPEDEQHKDFKALFSVVEPLEDTADAAAGIPFYLPEGFQFHANEVFLKKLTDQFLEFVKVIDKVEFFTIRDPKDSLPWLQIHPGGEAHVYLRIGSQVEFDFAALPSLENESEESFYCEYAVPRVLFKDPTRTRYLLSVIFENYDAIVISEIANDGPALKMKTFFPVDNPKSPGFGSKFSGAAAGVAAATGVAASSPNTRFFVARTEEDQSSQDETSTFDWL